MAHTVSHNPASVHAPSSGYSMGVELSQHRRLLFISGQVHLDPATGELIGGTPGEKAERCLENLTIIAEAAGAKLDNAVRIAVYVTDISVFAEMNSVYAGYFEQHPPAQPRRRLAGGAGDDPVEVETGKMGACGDVLAPHVVVVEGLSERIDECRERVHQLECHVAKPAATGRPALDRSCCPRTLLSTR